MRTFDLIIDGKTYIMDSVYSIYTVCRILDSIWTNHAIQNVSSFETFKKEKEVMYNTNETEENSYILLNELDLSKDMYDFTLFELVKLNTALGSLFKVECQKVDGTDPNLLGTVEAALYMCNSIYNNIAGLPTGDVISSSINKCRLHIPSGQEYIDIVEKIIDMPVFCNENISETAHKIFDPIIKLCKGDDQAC